MTTSSTTTARVATGLALGAAACEVMAAALIAPAWAVGAPVALLLAFLAGPLLFLALLVWRRRTHPGRSRLLFWVTVLVAAPGLAVLGLDVRRFRAEPPGNPTLHAHPVLVPLAQWAVVMSVWLVLVVQEARQKRRAT